MNKKENLRRPLVAVIASLIVASCSHNASPSSQVNDGFAAFKTTRNHAVTLVGNTKRSLDAADLNTLAVAYTNLQQKANAYASFMVEAITTSSFDSSRNTKYADDFATAIASFDKSYAALVATHRTMLGAAWVPPFAQTLQARWNQYNGVIANLTPQQKADLIADVKRATVWPNYEDIATEPV